MDSLSLIGRESELFFEDIAFNGSKLEGLVAESHFLVISGSGLSGVGSIIFRDEEVTMHGATASVNFYANVIAPYKGALEEWLVLKKSPYLYFLAAFVSAWAVLMPITKMAWKLFKGLSEPLIELKQALIYPFLLIMFYLTTSLKGKKFV